MNKLFLPIIAILLFTSCSPAIFYNAKLSPLQEESVKGEPIMLHGVYRQDLFFRALIAKIDEVSQYRIIAFNDFGIELFQIESKGITKTAISKSILPKKALNDFTNFFLCYLYAVQQDKIEEINGKIYYKIDNKPILWVQKD
ncbi:MAG: hypothetical protein LBN20_00470 [Endomicrobium sp.]|jgi:hypothetical protein|nr:hypothetical protein [Endomicrobium sp.]